MTDFASNYGIAHTQSELDFVNIDLVNDTPLYIDPYALTTKDDDWSIECHQLVVSFFESVLLAIKDNDNPRGIRLLSHLGEPRETRLGVSEDGNEGRGIGPKQARDIFNALKNSKAAKSGLLEDLSDFALFIPLVGRDKISDMTTNIIRGPLIGYTQNQCKLHSVPMRRVASGFYWNPESMEWEQDYVDLPVYQNQKILLVPKYIVRYQVGVSHADFRSKFVLEFLQEHHRKANDGLVTTIKNKKGVVTKKTVFKKTVDQYYPKDKNFLAEFSIAHPDVIDQYRDSLKAASSKIPNISRDIVNEKDLAEHLIRQLQSIPPGAKTADDYHNLMIGITSFLFFPNLIYPKKEAEINEGRKRIDVVYTNGKYDGFFYRISLDQNVKANVVHIECKNYTDDIANPEFDQLIARFDHNRGKLGILMYRQSEKPAQVLARCKDAAKSGQGIVLPMDDTFIIDCLKHVMGKERSVIDRKIDDMYKKIIS